MKKTILLAAVAASAFLLAACGQSTSTPSATAAATKPAPVIPEQQQPSEQAILAAAKGFNVGSMMSKRTVYVFFDSQCPHCARLWDETKGLQNQAKFVWIPVGVLNKSSTSQGAVILASADPIAAMNEHEKLMTARQGGIGGMDAKDEYKAVVTQNTKVLESFGVRSIPWSFTVHPETGTPMTVNGAPPAAVYAQMVALKAPEQGAATAPPVPATTAP